MENVTKKDGTLFYTQDRQILYILWELENDNETENSCSQRSKMFDYALLHTEELHLWLNTTTF